MAGHRFFTLRQNKSLNRTVLTMYKSYALWAPEMATHGGVQSYMWRLWEMLQLLKERNPHIHIKGVSLKDTSKNIRAWRNSTVERPPGMQGSRLCFIAAALGITGRADLVIVGHMNQSPVAWFAKRVGLIRDYVVVLHGIEAWQRASFLKRLAFRGARKLIATTRFTATICAELNDLETQKILVFPLCAEPRPDEPEAGFMLDGEWPILFVARLSKSEKYKGLETLIKAVADLQRDGKQIKLHVIGDGDDRPYLENIARTHLPKKDGVKFHGRVDGARLQAAYKSAKAFVMPSAKEGFGIVFLEAMRHGVPCIGGANGGTPEVFDDGVEGVLVPFRNQAALNASILKLMEEPDFASGIGEAGRMRFLRDYSFRNFAGHWTEVLQISHFQKTTDEAVH